MGGSFLLRRAEESWEGKHKLEEIFEAMLLFVPIGWCRSQLQQEHWFAAALSAAERRRSCRNHMKVAMLYGILLILKFSLNWNKDASIMKLLKIHEGLS